MLTPPFPSLLGYTCDHCVELTSDSLSRSLFIKLGVLSQFAGMAAAGGAQYMLFIGNVSVYNVVYCMYLNFVPTNLTLMFMYNRRMVPLLFWYCNHSP